MTADWNASPQFTQKTYAQMINSSGCFDVSGITNCYCAKDLCNTKAASTNTGLGFAGVMIVALISSIFH